MKSDVAFVLENAGWPALLVNQTGSIVRANQAAVKMFGPSLEGGATLLSNVWSPDNGVSADQFMAQWERSPTATVPLKFRVRGGGVGTFSVSICSFSRDGQRFFILQLAEPAAAAAPAVAGDTKGMSEAQAQKQKLDCALQLARTVSLDFNNALTSILGHTSLVLSQMEANHPWRNSMLEVEKSAAKAAEIANDLGTFSR